MSVNRETRIAVIGVGRMGIGIAHVYAHAGFQVDVFDFKTRSAEKTQQVLLQAQEQLRYNLEFLAEIDVYDEKLVKTIFDRVRFIPQVQVEQYLPEADVVFEAVPEILEIKRKAFETICSCVSSETLIASTTSTFLVDKLIEFVTERKRFMNTHWLNPAYLIPLVEVSPSEETGGYYVEKMIEVLEAAGKIPVRCNPSPGFIVPRIQSLAMNEAARIVEEGVATPEDIDKASRVGFGLRFAILGLIEFIDWGGGDILYYASNYLKEAFQDDKYAPAPSVVLNMKKGHIGMKAGKGFYDYDEQELTEYQKVTIRKFIDLLKHLGLLTLPHK